MLRNLHVISSVDIFFCDSVVGGFSTPLAKGGGGGGGVPSLLLLVFFFSGDEMVE